MGIVMINEKIVGFVANILEKRNYKITFYRKNCFHATHKDNCWISIEVDGETDELKIDSDICLSSSQQS